MTCVVVLALASGTAAASRVWLACPWQLGMPQLFIGRRQPQVQMISPSSWRSSALRGTACDRLAVLRQQRRRQQQQQQQQRRRRRRRPGTFAAANANAVSGSSARPVPSAITPKPSQIQLTSGLTVTA